MVFSQRISGTAGDGSSRLDPATRSASSSRQRSLTFVSVRLASNDINGYTGENSGIVCGAVKELVRDVEGSVRDRSSMVLKMMSPINCTLSHDRARSFADAHGRKNGAIARV